MILFCINGEGRRAEPRRAGEPCRSRTGRAAPGPARCANTARMRGAPYPTCSCPPFAAHRGSQRHRPHHPLGVQAGSLGREGGSPFGSGASCSGEAAAAPAGEDGARTPTGVWAGPALPGQAALRPAGSAAAEGWGRAEAGAQLQSPLLQAHKLRGCPSWRWLCRPALPQHLFSSSVVLVWRIVRSFVAGF